MLTAMSRKGPHELVCRMCACMCRHMCGRSGNGGHTHTHTHTHTVLLYMLQAASRYHFPCFWCFAVDDVMMWHLNHLDAQASAHCKLPTCLLPKGMQLEWLFARCMSRIGSQLTSSLLLLLWVQSSGGWGESHTCISPWPKEPFINLSAAMQERDGPHAIRLPSWSPFSCALHRWPASAAGSDPCKHEISSVQVSLLDDSPCMSLVGNERACLIDQDSSNDVAIMIAGRDSGKAQRQ